MTELIILAAGLGRRFATLAGDTPKVLLPVPSGRTLLAENLTSAQSTRVASRAVVVTGHRADLVAEEVAAHEWAKSIETVHNPDYATYGPVHSLWAARGSIERADVIVLNGDTYYRPEAFHAIADRPALGFRLLTSRRGVEHDDVKVTIRDGRLVAVGKHVPQSEADGVSAGIFMARGAAARAEFASVLGDVVRRERAAVRPVIWHDVVDELARRGDVRSVDVGHRSWFEVDTLDDYAALRTALDVTSVADAGEVGPR